MCRTVSDSFEPYVTKYAFYPSFPMPPQGERFGYARMQLTEHHWLVSDLDPRLGIKAIAETFPMDVLVWQAICLRLFWKRITDRWKATEMWEMKQDRLL